MERYPGQRNQLYRLLIDSLHLSDNNNQHHMTLEITNRQRTLLLESLTTRMQRIEEMIRIFEGDAQMEEEYITEFLDVEHLRGMITNTVNG